MVAQKQTASKSKPKPKPSVPAHKPEIKKGTIKQDGRIGPVIPPGWAEYVEVTRKLDAKTVMLTFMSVNPAAENTFIEAAKVVIPEHLLISLVDIAAEIYGHYPTPKKDDDKD